MKKITVIAIVLFYLVLSVGIRVTVHYCGDQVSSVDLFIDSKKCCGKKELAKCCKDNVSYLKLSDNQKHSPSFSFNAPDFSDVLIPSTDLSRFYLFVKQETLVLATPSYNRGKSPGKTPVFIINRSFRV